MLQHLSAWNHLLASPINGRPCFLHCRMRCKNKSPSSPRGCTKLTAASCSDVLNKLNSIKWQAGGASCPCPERASLQLTRLAGPVPRRRRDVRRSVTLHMHAACCEYGCWHRWSLACCDFVARRFLPLMTAPQCLASPDIWPRAPTSVGACAQVCRDCLPRLSPEGLRHR